MAMRRQLILISIILFGLVGCTTTNNTSSNQGSQDGLEQFEQDIDRLSDQLFLESQLNELFSTAKNNTAEYQYPIADYAKLRSSQVFGQYSEAGYHTGDDLIVTDSETVTAVVAITDAIIVKKETISGYGGVVILEFVQDTQTYHALYTQLNLDSVIAKVGDSITAGETLGQIQVDKTTWHFGIFPYNGAELLTENVAVDADLAKWENPFDFIRERLAGEAIVQY